MTSPFADVRPHERPRFRFFLLLSALLGAAQVVGVAASEALFLAEFGVAWLPHTFVAAALFTVVVSYLYATVVGRTRNDRLFEQMLVISAVVLATVAGGIAAGVTLLLPVLICLYWANYAVFLNHYWTFTGDYFDTLASKRLFPLFTVGASLGSIAGGVATALASRIAPPLTLVALWALALLAAAVLLHRQRRDLRRWGPLELEEADDTSVAGIQGALLLIRSTSIGRRLALAAIAMVLSLFVLQYLYSDVFARSFDTAEELAFFFGAYLIVTNVLEVAVEIWITPYLIRRFGVASTNVVHPLLTLASFGLLAVDYRLGAATIARANREMLENAMAGPVRNLVYNAIPTKVRGASLALLYFLATLGVRRQYLRTLVAELREGRLDLESLSGDLGNWELSRLAELWRTMLTARDERAAQLASQLAPQLGARGAVAALRTGLDHDDAEVRRACVAALGQVDDPAGEDALLVALDDEAAAVRLAAVHGLPLEPGMRSQERALRRRLRDTDPRVRAAAAVRLGEEGETTLTEMLDADDVVTVRAALRVLPRKALEQALVLIDRDKPEIQATLLDAAARLLAPVPFEPERLAGLAEHASARLRRAAVVALATRDEPEVAAILAERLGDRSRAVRVAAAAALSARGSAGLAAAESRLRSDATRAVEGAILTFAGSTLPEARVRLGSELAHRVQQAWRALLCLHALGPPDDRLEDRFLRIAVSDAVGRNWGLAFFLLENTEEPGVMRSVEKALRFATARSRGNALEVLSNLGDRETARLMVLLAEPGPVADKLGSLGEHFEVPTDVEGARALARESSNRWIRTSFALDRVDGAERDALEDTMEKLLALKQVPLFAHFSLEQLEGITRVTRDLVCHAGQKIVDEGATGGELYVVLTGRVRVFKNHGTPAELDLGTLERGSYFGEMAIFDNQPRSATVVAEDDARLLVLAGDRLKDFVMQTPEMSFQIFEVLTTRIREVEARLDTTLRERS